MIYSGRKLDDGYFKKGMVMAQHDDPIGMPMREQRNGAGFFGVLKLLVTLAVVAIGGLAILFVFDVLSLGLLQDLALKIAASTAIGLVVVAAVAFLGRSK